MFTLVSWTRLEHKRLLCSIGSTSHFLIFFLLLFEKMVLQSVQLYTLQVSNTSQILPAISYSRKILGISYLLDESHLMELSSSWLSKRMRQTMSMWTERSVKMCPLWLFINSSSLLRVLSGHGRYSNIVWLVTPSILLSRSWSDINVSFWQTAVAFLPGNGVIWW